MFGLNLRFVETTLLLCECKKQVGEEDGGVGFCSLVVLL